MQSWIYCVRKLLSYITQQCQHTHTDHTHTHTHARVLARKYDILLRHDAVYIVGCIPTIVDKIGNIALNKMVWYGMVGQLCRLVTLLSCTVLYNSVTLICAIAVVYTVVHKKRAILFSFITQPFLGQFLILFVWPTNGNINEYSLVLT